ncbi:hypothetical protein [Bradyrhizobium sp. HKCCYLS2038]|uniref:hypothetical protein n=1 Tax=Bradyrhizobium sp. HKCCYLS2038 TaxID=3420764 RepID=UPI003EB92093
MKRLTKSGAARMLPSTGVIALHATEQARLCSSGKSITVKKIAAGHDRMRADWL